jgi:hypothetical protein
LNYFRTKKSKPSSSIPDLKFPIISKPPVKPVKNKVESTKNLIPDLPKFIGIPSLPSKIMATKKTRETTGSLPDLQNCSRDMAGNSKVKKNDSDFDKRKKRKKNRIVTLCDSPNQVMAGNSKNKGNELEESSKKKRKRDKNQYETITIE